MIGGRGFERAILRGLRAAWQRNTARRQAVQAQMQDQLPMQELPGPGESRVGDGSIDRIVQYRVTEYLRRDSRHRLSFGEIDARDLSDDERQIISLLTDLRDGREQRAELRAQWLVEPDRVSGLLARMRPLAEIANQRDVTDAELHRQSARAIMDTHQLGAL